MYQHVQESSDPQIVQAKLKASLENRVDVRQFEGVQVQGQFKVLYRDVAPIDRKVKILENLPHSRRFYHLALPDRSLDPES